MKINIITLFILLFHFNVYAQLHDIPFKKGEKLEYKIHYGPIAAGMASLEVKTFQDQFKFIATGKSNRVFSLLDSAIAKLKLANESFSTFSNSK